MEEKLLDINNEDLKFKIDSITFESKIDYSDNVNIKSYNKIYNVVYNNKKLLELLNDIYNDNDFIIIDNNVYKLYCKNTDFVNYYLFDANENTKTINTVLEIVDILYNLKFNKKNKLIVIGGGITQDVGGFVAAIYKRGLNWIYIPTTLLSMTDSAIGSKINVNRNSKNMLGLFYSPNKIYISEYFLNTLKHEDIISGLGESLKLSLIGGINSYNYFIENYKNKNYTNIIKISTFIKKIIIEHDELEKNERKVLNYGHTFGHALESASNYFIPHGIAVLYGMYIINKLFYDDKYNDINIDILQMIPDKYKNIKISYNEFINHLLNDKKNDGDNICFILLDNIGISIFKYYKISEIEQKTKQIFDLLFINIF